MSAGTGRSSGGSGRPDVLTAGKPLLKALSVTGTRLRPVDPGDAAAPGDWILCRKGRATGKTVPAADIRKLLAQGLLQEVQGELVLSPEGRQSLRRLLSGGDGHLDQHREIVWRDFPAPGGKVKVRAAVNLRESPLGWLASRKDRQGRALLDRVQIEAGERLRADYAFARLMPSLSKGWRTQAGGARSGGRGADLGIDVIAARQRLQTILDGLEPVLASLLVDVCCHLKGLEQVETERGWPARSGKVVLQIALSALAARYGLVTVAAEGMGRIRSGRT